MNPYPLELLNHFTVPSMFFLSAGTQDYEIWLKAGRRGKVRVALPERSQPGPAHGPNLRKRSVPNHRANGNITARTARGFNSAYAGIRKRDTLAPDQLDSHFAMGP